MGCGASRSEAQVGPPATPREAGAPRQSAEATSAVRRSASRETPREGTKTQAPASVRPASASASAAAAAADPLAASKLGITLRGLRRLVQQLEQRFGSSLDSMSTTDVMTQHVQQLTAGRRCRFLELGPEVVDPGDVRPPMYFISHAWKNRARRLFSLVLAFLRDADETSTSVWIDILAVNQHAGSQSQQHDVSPEAFGATVRACGAGTLVILDNEVCSPATRAWCIFEWTHTILLHGPDGLHLHLRPGDRSALLNSIDVEKAECFMPEDKAMILGEVRKHHGSPARFNSQLKLQLLLEPLSYRVDLRRLTQGAATAPPPPPPPAGAAAAAAGWDFGPVDAWMADSSRGRLLCISAGAGEGKSTASAVLCGREGGKMGVAAHHFVKYSDVRRLDPVRIVKSLAFQLADRLEPVCDLILQQDAAQMAQMTDMEDAFTRLLLRPLEAYQQQQAQQPPQMVMLLDALDEADPPQPGGASLEGATLRPACPLVCGNRVLQLLVAHLRRLPPWVRFIVTTRPGAASGQMLPCLERAFAGGVTHLTPGALRRPGSASSRAKPAAAAAATARPASSSSTSSRSAAAAPPAAVRSSSGAGGGPQGSHQSSARGAAAATGPGGGGGSGGVLLYHTAAAALADAAASLPTPAPASPNLDDVYELYDKVFGLSYKRCGEQRWARVVELLEVLLAAREPLSQSFLQQLGLGSAVADLPGSPRLFFVDEHHVYMTHGSVGDWLLDGSRSGRFAVTLKRGHTRIGTHLAASCRTGGGGSGGADAAAEATLPYMYEYSLKYGVGHLAAGAGLDTGDIEDEDGGGGSAVRALDGLLCDMGFLQAVLAAGHAPAVVGDLGDLRAHTRCSRDVLRWLQGEQFNLAGKTVAEVAAHALATVPVGSPLFEAAVAETGQPWRTRLLLPESARGWRISHKVLKGHPDKVLCVAFSPDSRQLASAGTDDPLLRIWIAATGRCSATLPGHTGGANAVAFSPDGRQLLSGGEDSAVRVWDAATGQCEAVLTGHSGGVRCVAFRPDGERLASGGGDRTIRLWGAPVGADGDSGDGSATTTAATWQCLMKLEGHGDLVRCLSFSPFGWMLASGGEDSTVRLWNVGVEGSGWCTATVDDVFDDDVNAVAFSPAGDLVVACCSDGKMVRYDPAEERTDTIAELAGGEVKAAAFSPDGQVLISGDQVVRVWDPDTWSCMGSFEGGTGYVQSLAASPDGRLLAAGRSDETIRLWEVADGWKPAGATKMDKDVVRSLAFSAPAGELLAAGSRDGTVRVYDTAAGKRVARLAGHEGTVLDVAFAPGEEGAKVLASAGQDGSLRLWDLSPSGGGIPESFLRAMALPPEQLAMMLALAGAGSQPECTATLTGHKGPVRCLVFSPDGARLASGGADGSVRLWDRAAGGCVATLQGHEGAVHRVAFSPDGRTLASCGEDKTVRVWRCGDSGGGTSAACLAELRGHEGPVFAVAFSPDGSRLVSGGDDKTMRVWAARAAGVHECVAVVRADVRVSPSLEELNQQQDFSFLAIQGAMDSMFRGKVYGLAFSPDGSRLASANNDEFVRLWDVGSWECVGRLAGHREEMGGVMCVAFSPDGGALASGGFDEEIRVWGRRGE